MGDTWCLVTQENQSRDRSSALASLKCFPRLVYSALVLVNIPIPTCRQWRMVQLKSPVC